MNIVLRTVDCLLTTLQRKDLARSGLVRVKDRITRVTAFWLSHHYSRTHTSRMSAPRASRLPAACLELSSSTMSKHHPGKLSASQT